MATMATLVADLLKKIFTSEFSWVFITPHLTTFFIFFFNFNLGVAIVAHDLFVNRRADRTRALAPRRSPILLSRTFP